MAEFTLLIILNYNIANINIKSYLSKKIHLDRSVRPFQQERIVILPDKNPVAQCGTSS